MRIATAHLVVGIVALGACGGTPPPAGPEPPEAESTIDSGKLVLRSMGTEIGSESFELTRERRLLRVGITARTKLPDSADVRMVMHVDESSWHIADFNLYIERGFQSCELHLRSRGAEMELEVEYSDESSRVVSREPREHAQYFVAMLPAFSQSAVCAVADDGPREMESWPPWHVTRTAPRAITTYKSADGARNLARIKVDEAIDVYCDGSRLAIVHYPKHAFTAARTEYDSLARELSATDPTDDPWSGDIGCPAR